MLMTIFLNDLLQLVFPARSLSPKHDMFLEVTVLRGHKTFDIMFDLTIKCIPVTEERAGAIKLNQLSQLMQLETTRRRTRGIVVSIAVTRDPRAGDMLTPILTSYCH